MEKYFVPCIEINHSKKRKYQEMIQQKKKNDPPLYTKLAIFSFINLTLYVQQIPESICKNSNKLVMAVS